MNDLSAKLFEERWLFTLILFIWISAILCCLWAFYLSLKSFEIYKCKNVSNIWFKLFILNLRLYINHWYHSIVFSLKWVKNSKKFVYFDFWMKTHVLIQKFDFSLLISVDWFCRILYIWNRDSFCSPQLIMMSAKSFLSPWSLFEWFRISASTISAPVLK